MKVSVRERARVCAYVCMCVCGCERETEKKGEHHEREVKGIVEEIMSRRIDGGAVEMMDDGYMCPPHFGCRRT